MLSVLNVSLMIYTDHKERCFLISLRSVPINDVLWIMFQLQPHWGISLWQQQSSWQAVPRLQSSLWMSMCLWIQRVYLNQTWIRTCKKKKKKHKWGYMQISGMCKNSNVTVWSVWSVWSHFYEENKSSALNTPLNALVPFVFNSAHNSSHLIWSVLVS